MHIIDIIDIMDISEYFCDVSELMEGQLACCKHQSWFDDMDCFLDEYGSRDRKKSRKGKKCVILKKAQRQLKQQKGGGS